MRRAALVLALLLALPLRPALAEPLDPTPPFIIELQNAIRNDDKDWFLKHYATVIGPDLKANILKPNPETYFKNYQGVMVGDGGRNIWLDDFGDEGAGIPARFEIITINNSD